MIFHRLILPCFVAYILVGALLFMRPHQETFIGLDNSAIRLMTHAMGQGRAQLGVDHTLKKVPVDLRERFLYQPDHGQRLTRDRSFQLDDLEGCAYRPWFYPFLSYTALALDWIVPGPAMDYFLPALTLFFFSLAGWFMVAGCGLAGLAAALGLTLGMPLLPWFARGYYPELAGLLLMALAALNWMDTDHPLRRLYPTAFILGLAVCFHPLLALWCGAFFLLLTGDERLGPRHICLAAVSTAIGALPLTLITWFVTQPYGPLFSPRWLSMVFQSHTLFFIFIIGAVTCVATVVVFFFQAGRNMFQKLVFSPSSHAHALRILLAISPSAILLLAGSTRPEILNGLTDLWTLVASPYGLAVGATLIASLHSSVRPKPRALLVMVVALAPVFLYLKGVEPFGLWSQRRLLPITVPMLVAALAIWRDVLATWAATPWKPRLASGGLLLLAALMIYQQPSFYLLRSEHGADAVMSELRHVVKENLTIFDYHEYGSPLTALGQEDVLAMSSRASIDHHVQVIQWIAAQARQRPALWVTAYANPGLEQGLGLEMVQHIENHLPRLHAKRVFPADPRNHVLSMRLLALRPLHDNDPPPRLDKILDRGNLAMRGPWGRGDIGLQAPDKTILPARWTREGSGIIGPVPDPGQAVFVELIAGAYSNRDIDHQVMIITPPWNGPALELEVGNMYTQASGLLHRPIVADVPRETTGHYVLTARYPYDPSSIGIKGFDPDMGVLLHRVRMETVRTDESIANSDWHKK